MRRSQASFDEFGRAPEVRKRLHADRRPDRRAVRAARREKPAPKRQPALPSCAVCFPNQPVSGLPIGRRAPIDRRRFSRATRGATRLARTARRRRRLSERTIHLYAAGGRPGRRRLGLRYPRANCHAPEHLVQDEHSAGSPLSIIPPGSAFVLKPRRRAAPAGESRRAPGRAHPSARTELQRSGEPVRGFDPLATLDQLALAAPSVPRCCGPTR